jgi:diphthine-ammonia ligase
MHALLWSGGKDSCLALWRAHLGGLAVPGLLNFFAAETGRVRFHGTRAGLIADQAAALGLQLFQVPALPDDYAAAFDHALAQLAERGYQGVIAGDIHLLEVRAWNEARAAAAGLELSEPLWQEHGATLLHELVEAGFRAVLTCCQTAWPEVLWPGREIDHAFIAEVDRVPGLDACGENGEYHSFVYDGPLFRRPVEWRAGTLREAPGFRQLDLLPTSLEEARPAAAGGPLRGRAGCRR